MDLLEKARQELDDIADLARFARGVAIGTLLGLIVWGIFFWVLWG